MLRKIMTSVAVASLALVAAACNTVEGAGEDLQSVSEDVNEEI